MRENNLIFKRFCSILLTIAVVLTMMPTMAWAADAECTEHVYKCEQGEEDHDGQHRKVCKVCGAIENEGVNNGYVYCTTDGTIKYYNEQEHCTMCICGRVLTGIQHTFSKGTSDDGTKHLFKCTECGYSFGEGEHTYDADGMCTDCRFKQVAADHNGNIYGTVADALDKVSDGGWVKLESRVPTEPKEISANVDFNRTGSAELRLNGYTLKHSSGTSVTVENGELTISGNGTVEGNILVKGGTLNIAGGTINNLTVNGGRVRISGGTFVKPLTLNLGAAYADVLAGGYAFAKNGKLLKLSEMTNATDFAVKKCTDHTELDENGKCIYCGLAFVAKVGNASYTTLAAAFAAAGRTGMVTLIDDVSLTEQLRFTSGNVTLDLDGKKITCDVIGNAIQVSGGTLTIKDGSANKSGEICDSYDLISSAVCVSGGKLILESGNYTTSGDYSTAVKQMGGSLEIKGGSFTVGGGETSYAVLLEGGTEFKISGNPELTAHRANSQRCLVIGENYSGKVSLAGGTFEYIKFKNKMTVKDLLAAGYGFNMGKSAWAVESQLASDEIANVTVLKAPIQGLEYPKSLSMNYGETKEITAKAEKDPSVSEEVKYLWYFVDAGGTQNPHPDGAFGNLTLSNLSTGRHIYRVMASCDGYTYMSGDITVTVNKAEPTYEAPTAIADLSYDRQEQALITDGKSKDGKMVYSLEKDGLYRPDIPTGTNAGTYQVWYKVLGDPNHTDTKPKSIEATIAPRILSDFIFEGSFTKVYDGTTGTDVKIVGFKGKDGKEYTLKEGVDYKQTYLRYSSPNVGDCDHVYEGERNSLGIHFEIILISANYTFPSGKIATAAYGKGAAITKAPVPTLSKTGELTIVKGETAKYSFDLKSLLPELPGDCIYGSVTYGQPSLDLDAAYGVTASIKDGILTLKTAPNGTPQTTEDGKITIDVETRNYKTFPLTVNIKATDKKQPQLDGKLTLSRDTLTYGEALSSIEIFGKMTVDGSEIDGTFTWLNPDMLPKASEAYTAGWKFTPKEADKYAEVTGTATLKVNKTDPTGTPQYTPIREAGKTLTDANLMTEGGNFSPAGRLYWAQKYDNGDFMDITSLASLYEVKRGEAWWWVFEPYDTENYNKLSGMITLWPKSSGGGGSSTVTPTEPTNPTQPTEPTKPNTPDGTLTPAQSKLAKGVQNTTIVLKSKLLKNGKICLAWTKSKGYKVDRFEIYRSVKKNSGYGKKTFFSTKDGSWSKYLNTKELKKGKTYYYKLRGVRTIGGKKYYTKWSNKTWKTVK